MLEAFACWITWLIERSYRSPFAHFNTGGTPLQAPPESQAFAGSQLQFAPATPIHNQSPVSAYSAYVYPEYPQTSYTMVEGGSSGTQR